VAREKRVKRKKRNKSENNYFASEKPIGFISTGCQLLNCVLGGGVAEGRVFNIVGDKSSGKTLQAIEVCANFYDKHGSSADINYQEAESAFDKPYAQALGMPVDIINFVGEDDPKNDNTVEYTFEKITEKIAELRISKRPALWITDSLDALSDRAEKARDIDEGSYGMGKQKKMSEMFRRLISEMNEVNLTLFIVSQIRDKIGAMFGEKKSRTGGKALDFYASQVLWLAEIKKLRKTIRGVKRVYGIQVKAQCKKNKVGLPFRDCEFPTIFGYGVDDLTASLEWLDQVKALSELNITKKDIPKIVKENMAERDTDFVDEVNALVREVWSDIEVSFLPKGKKY